MSKKKIDFSKISERPGELNRKSESILINWVKNNLGKIKLFIGITDLFASQEKCFLN